jgi:hypothetical protein
MRAGRGLTARIVVTAFYPSDRKLKCCAKREREREREMRLPNSRYYFKRELKVLTDIWGATFAHEPSQAKYLEVVVNPEVSLILKFLLPDNIRIYLCMI